MRIPILLLTNGNKIRENQIAREQTVIYNAHLDEYTKKKPIPKSIVPKHKETFLCIRNSDIKDYFIDTSMKNTIVVNTHTRGEIRCPYNPEIANQLEVILSL